MNKSIRIIEIIKEIYKSRLKYISLIIVAGITLFACSDDIDDVILGEDTRIEGKDMVVILHVNPKTGEEYTGEELAELDYDPAVEEYYSESQKAEIFIWTQQKPNKLEISLGGSAEPIQIISSFSRDDRPNLGDYKDGYGYSGKWKTNVEELGIALDEQVTYDIKVTYHDVGIDGFTTPSVRNTTFTIHHHFYDDGSGVVIPVGTGAKLIRSTGETKDIPLVHSEGISLEVYENVLTGFPYGEDGEYATWEDDPDLDFRNTGDFSVGLWVNTTFTISDPSMMGDKDWGSGSNPGFVLAFTGSNWKLNAGDGSNRIDISSPNDINDGEWHYLMVTFDRDGLATIYEDGVDVGNTNMSAIGDFESGYPIRLAQEGTGTYGIRFEGLIGNSEIFDYALDPSQAAAAAIMPTPPEPPTGATLITEAGSTTNLTVTDSGGTESGIEDGKFTFTFDGFDSYSTIEDGGALDFRTDDNFSVAVWVNTTATNSDPSIIGDKNWASGSQPGFVFSFLGGNWKLNAGDGSNRIDFSSPNDINDGEWHLLVVTFDRAGNAVVYEDGVLLESLDISGFSSMGGEYPIRLAQDGTGLYGSFFEGKVADAMIYDYVLTAGEVAALYQ